MGHPLASSSPARVPTLDTKARSSYQADIPNEHHDFFLSWEHPPQRQHHPPLLTSHSTHGITRWKLTRLSTRPYAARVSDPSDFASAWEFSVVPLLAKLFHKHCTSDFSVDVHNFPEASSEAVPRVIYITLSGNASTAYLEHTVRSALDRIIPSRFRPIDLVFRRGEVQKTNWWGKDAGEQDQVCEPQNVAYQSTPVIGMSIGPAKTSDAASLGGFVQVGSELYAMSAFHTFEEPVKACQLRVSHPAEPDVPLVTPSVPGAVPYDLGSVAMCSSPGSLRSSLTFRGTGVPQHLAMVGMDWCLIRPMPNGKNFVSVPSFRMDRRVAVQSTAPVEGNTEVYAVTRTSGYSLGFTSDVPGLQRTVGQLRREWTVRQYSPLTNPRDGRANAPWQTLKQWVTSGIGVPGDSGAWLIRRSDNAVVGQIWARNHNSGDPLERVRLTYFTPMPDILADIQQSQADGQEVSLPLYSEEELAREVQVRESRERVEIDPSWDPWSPYAWEAIREHHQTLVDLIESHFVDDNVPMSGTAPDRRLELEEPLAQDGPSTMRSPHTDRMESSLDATGPPPAPVPRSNSGDSLLTLSSEQKMILLGLRLSPEPELSLPELSAASSIHSGCSIADEDSEMISVGHCVRIVSEFDPEDDIVDIE